MLMNKSMSKQFFTWEILPHINKNLQMILKSHSKKAKSEDTIKTAEKRFIKDIEYSTKIERTGIFNLITG